VLSLKTANFRPENENSATRTLQTARLTLCSAAAPTARLAQFLKSLLSQFLQESARFVHIHLRPFAHGENERASFSPESSLFQILTHLNFHDRSIAESDYVIKPRTRVSGRDASSRRLSIGAKVTTLGFSRKPSSSEIVSITKLTH
jgi:hypothetical protein